MKQERKNLITHRSQAVAHYIIYNKCTMKSAAKVFAVSIDTVSDDINKRLNVINPKLYSEVRKVIDNNKKGSLSRARAAKAVAK